MLSFHISRSIWWDSRGIVYVWYCLVVDVFIFSISDGFLSTGAGYGGAGSSGGLIS